jgi:hypothetical protein
MERINTLKAVFPIFLPCQGLSIPDRAGAKITIKLFLTSFPSNKIQKNRRLAVFSMPSTHQKAYSASSIEAVVKEKTASAFAVVTWATFSILTALIAAIFSATLYI